MNNIVHLEKTEDTIWYSIFSVVPAQQLRDFSVVNRAWYGRCVRFVQQQKDVEMNQIIDVCTRIWPEKALSQLQRSYIDLTKIHTFDAIHDYYIHFQMNVVKIVRGCTVQESKLLEHTLVSSSERIMQFFIKLSDPKSEANQIYEQFDRIKHYYDLTSRQNEFSHFATNYASKKYYNIAIKAINKMHEKDFKKKNTVQGILTALLGENQSNIFLKFAGYFSQYSGILLAFVDKLCRENRLELANNLAFRIENEALQNRAFTMIKRMAAFKNYKHISNNNTVILLKSNKPTKSDSCF